MRQSMMRLVLAQTSAPAVEPLSLDEAKLHLRVDIGDDNELITALIVAARQYVEGATNRALISQTWRLSLDYWPYANCIRLPKPPLQSVTSLVYLDEDGNQTTWDASNYIVDTDSEPGRLVLADDASWPSLTLYPSNPIRVTYVAGYGDEGSDVPEHLRLALKLLIGHWYENREAIVSTGAVPKEIPLAVESLINLHRVFA